MTLPRQWEKHALALIDAASPLTGEFFRSVEIAYAHPDDVVSGEGTRLYGGRFVKSGMRAVYGSADEETALRESSARTSRLARRSGIAMIEYPRITYVIAVKAATCVDLSTASTDAASIVPACLAASDLAASQPRWTVENRQLVDSAKPAISRAAETSEFYFVPLSARKSVCSIVTTSQASSSSSTTSTCIA